MKYLFVALILVSCGKNTDYIYKDKIIEKDKIVEIKQLFEGKYYLSNNSYIELIQGSDDFVTISTDGQLLVTINPENNTYGELPKISGKYLPVNNKIKFSKNYNYTSGLDIEHDLLGSNITGSKKTDVTIEFIDQKLQITFEVYSNSIGNNINEIVAKRVFNED